MRIDTLWAPWRIKYLKTIKQKGCIFCKAAKSKGKDYVVLKTKHSLVVLNIYPYNNGHLMVAPIRHLKSLKHLTEDETLDIASVLNKMTDLLDKTLHPDGFNIGMNLSRSAGAGITGHMHIHIVPRWTGDSNFMTTVSNTRIISQSLGQLHKLLKNAGSKKNKKV